MKVGAKRQRKTEREETVFVKVKRAPDTGEGELSLTTYSLVGCSKPWKKKTDKIGCYGGQPGIEGWGMVCRLSSTVLTGNCENP